MTLAPRGVRTRPWISTDGPDRSAEPLMCSMNSACGAALLYIPVGIG